MKREVVSKKRREDGSSPYFEICIFVLLYILTALHHLALQVNVSQRRIRRRCLVLGGGTGAALAVLLQSPPAVPAMTDGLV